MSRKLIKPILYLITAGRTSKQTKPEDPEFQEILSLVSAAVDARLGLIQIREKQLNSRSLFDLTTRAAAITKGSETRLLVNDRADIAAAAGADGVHLTSRSLNVPLIRRVFGKEFLIGVSAHAVNELHVAQHGGADLAVLGPVFATASKIKFGPPLGLKLFSGAVSELARFPMVALGGVTVENAKECFRAGAAGIAGISLFDNESALGSVANQIRSQYDLTAK